MVLKTLGKKLKSLGRKSKTSKKEVAPTTKPVAGGNALPLHKWKGAAPDKSGKKGPKLGGSREDKSPAPDKGGPSPWVKGKSGSPPPPGQGPLIGTGRNNWKPGEKPGVHPKGLPMMGAGRTKKGDEVPTPEKNAPPPGQQDKPNPYLTSSGGDQSNSKNPYLTTNYGATPYTTDHSDVPFFSETESSQPGESSPGGEGEQGGSPNKYLAQYKNYSALGEQEYSNPISTSASGKDESGSGESANKYFTKKYTTVADQGSQADMSASNSDSGGHGFLVARNEGTSAFEHSNQGEQGSQEVLRSGSANSGSESNQSGSQEHSSRDPQAKERYLLGEQNGETNYDPLAQGGQEEVGGESPATKYLTSGGDGGSNYLSSLVSIGTYQQPDYNQFSTSSSNRTSSEEQVEVRKGEPDVQGVTGPSSNEKVAKMQQNLRNNTSHNKDMPEKVRGGTVPVTRGETSRSEKKSQGWGLLPMRDSYRNRRDKNGEITKGHDRNILGDGKATQYFLARGETLELEARKVLASNLKAGRGTKRDDTVIRFVGGKWIGADNSNVDTSEVQALTYSINEQREKLGARLKDPALAGLDKKLLKIQEQIQSLRGPLEKQQESMRKMGMAGRYIFVMNAAGEFFAGKSITGVVHHSSFLAGGAVAAAGEVAISGGKMTAISNVSGHYRPGPVYLWQAVKQLEMLGVPLAGLRVDVMGVNKNFKNAAEFLGAMDPVSNPLMFDSGEAVKHLNAYFTEKSKNKVKEDDTIKTGEDTKGEVSPGIGGK